MCVPYIGGCSVHRGCSVDWGNTMSTSGGYHDDIEGCSVYRGILWVHWEMFSTLGDIMSTSGRYHEYIGRYHDACGGYYEYIGGYPEYIGGYPEYIGGCSIHLGDIMICVGDIMRTLGDVWLHRVFNINWKAFITLLPTCIMISPDVLMISPWCTHGIPWCTEHPSLRCTEHPPTSWTSPNVLNTNYKGWKSTTSCHGHLGLNNLCIYNVSANTYLKTLEAESTRHFDTNLWNWL